MRSDDARIHFGPLFHWSKKSAALWHSRAPRATGWAYTTHTPPGPSFPSTPSRPIRARHAPLAGTAPASRSTGRRRSAAGAAGAGGARCGTRRPRGHAGRATEVTQALAGGASIEAATDSGVTPFRSVAALHGDVDVVTALADAGAKVSATDNTGHAGDVAAARAMRVYRGAGVARWRRRTAKEKAGMTALMAAAFVRTCRRPRRSARQGRRCQRRAHSQSTSGLMVRDWRPRRCGRRSSAAVRTRTCATSGRTRHGDGSVATP